MANETQIYVGKLGAQTLYKRLKQLIGRITTYKKVLADEQGNPIESNPDSRTIYLVKDESVVGEDKFFEWIWTAPNIWECIGTTSEPCNSWKQWSEDNGSSGEGDSVYIGKNNDLGRDESYSLGKDNTVEVTDETDYTDTDVVAIGTANMATNAANTYQLGRENSVSGNNLAQKQTYPHSMAMNLGSNNAITGEGVNIGKDNDATTFGINIGQNNFSSNASCSVGQHVMSDNASLSVGSAYSTSDSMTVGNVPSMLVNGSYSHVHKFRIKNSYHHCAYATIYKDTSDNKYKWADVQLTSLNIFPNYELDQYLVSWGSWGQSGIVTGYYDDQGEFHPSTDQSQNIHTYALITYVGNSSGSEQIQQNPPFYANFVDQAQSRCYLNYVIRTGVTLPDYGRILNRAEYEAIIASSVVPVMSGKVSDLYIDLNDLTADGYTANGLSNDTTMPMPMTYEVYGYQDNGVLVPYNELNKKEEHDFHWYEVSADTIQGKTLPVKQINPRVELITAINRSATFGMGSLYASGRSITISTNSISSYQMRYQDTYETNMYHTYSGKRYTIDQLSGSYSTQNVTISCFTKPYGGSFTSKVAPCCASAEGSSIVISNEYGTAYGSSVAIGNYANASGFAYAIGRSSTANNDAFAFGHAAFGYEHSMALGFDSSYATKASLSFGIGGVSAYERSVAIGFDGITSQKYSLAIACGGYANGKSMIFGFNNNASNDAIAIGRSNSIYNEATGLGANNVMYYQNIAIGYSNNMQNTSDTSVHATLIGTSNTTGPGGYNIGIGKSNTVSGESITIGTSNSADGWSIVLGYNNTTSNSAGAHSTIIGYNNTSTSSLETLLKSYTEHIDTPYTPSQEEIDAINDCISAMNSVMTKYMSSTDCATCTTYYTQYRDYVLGIGAEPTYTTEISTLIGSLRTAGAKYNVSKEDKDYYNNVLPTLSSDQDAYIQALLDLLSKYTDVDKYYSLVGQGYNALYYSELGREFNNLHSDFYWYGINYDGPTQTSIITDDTDYATYWNAYNQYYSYCHYINQNRINGQNGYDQQVSDSISCNSVVMGSNNTANHYNSILIGAYNSSLAPSSETQVSDDDGFTLAIGYKNTVGRNYDFAFGYRSVANGGENIAIQHSSAIGYRNIAMIDSTVTGIANIALVESTFTPSNTLSAHNFLFNSIGTVEATGSDSGGVQRNVFIDSYHDITAQNVSENFIFGGTGKQHDISPVTITGGKGASGNIMFGSPHKSTYDSGTFTITTSSSTCDNVFIHPKEVNISADTIQNTAIMGNSTVNMAVSSSILDNIISASTLSGTCHTLHGNTFISKSSLATERTGSTDGSIRYNLVMNESSVYANKNVYSFWTGSSQPIAYNIVSGSIASDTHACIAIGDGMLDSQPTNTVANSKFSIVIGDNYAERTQITTAIGTENNVVSADHTIVYGTLNNVIGQGNTLSSNGIISTSLVFGRENIVHTHSNGTGYNLAYGTVIGTKNYLYATRADSIQIFGTENIVSKDVVPVSKTVEQITAIQQQFESDQSISYPSIVKFSNSGTIIRYNGSMPSQRYTTQVTAGDVFVFSPYENYNHVVFALQGAKQRENARLLPTDDYIGLNINNVLIAGNGNTVGDRIVGYTILGRDNTLTNQLNPSSTTFAISNGFIQGSNNTVSNGSHIVCMGNSNEATGHDSVAIGMHLKSNQWQTVLGKYNEAKEGTRRILEEYDSTKTYTGYSCYVSHNHIPYVLTSSSASGTWDATKWREQWPDGDKVIFAIGHGYSTKEDSSNWQNESYMTRSNAVEVMGDGRLVALKGLSSYKSAYFDGGIQLYRGDLVLGNGNITVSNGNITSNNIPAAPSTDGTYALQCVVANGTETYNWVRIGISTI